MTPRYPGFFADRTNSRAYDTVLRPSVCRLSVCNVGLCFIANRCVITKKTV